MDGYFGEIRLFSFNYTPVNWVSCNGSNFQLAQCQALQFLLASTYGQLTSTTVTLPNLNGRTPVAAGAPDPAAAKLPIFVSQYALGQQVGAPTVTLDGTNGATGIISHRHSVTAKLVTISPWPGMASIPDNTSYLSRATRLNPSNNLQATFDRLYATAPDTTLHPSTLSPVGNAAASVQAHENRQPYLVMNYCLCIVGNFPTPANNARRPASPRAAGGAAAPTGGAAT